MIPEVAILNVKRQGVAHRRPHDSYLRPEVLKLARMRQNPASLPSRTRFRLLPLSSERQPGVAKTLTGAEPAPITVVVN